MKQSLFLKNLLTLLLIAISLTLNATIHNYQCQGNITIYVGVEKTISHPFPYNVYVNASSDGWYLSDVDGATSYGQEIGGVKIVSSNSSSCTIKAMFVSSNSKLELHCKGTRQSQNEEYVCYWNITVVSYGSIYVDASPSFGTWNNPTMVEAGTKVYLNASIDNSVVSDARIYYTTDVSSNPSESSTPYTSDGITINKKTYLAAIACKSGYSPVICGGYYDIKETPISVTSITLNKNSLSLHLGEEETLTATVKPDNAADKTVTWSSTPIGIVSVSNSGEVKAIASGKTEITCEANDGSGVKATCNVTVKAVGIDINAANFPDQNFRNYLLSQSYGQDEVLTDEEINGITALSLNPHCSCIKIQS